MIRIMDWRTPTAIDHTALHATRPWLMVEHWAVRSREVNSGPFTHEQVFAVVLLWDAPADDAVTWTGWITTVNHESLRFCAADLERAIFRQWLADLPGWEPGSLARALASHGLHQVWRLPS
jgi:hypothetical protein